MEFYEKLQHLRRKKGMTQEELAQALYVSRTAVSKWESGRGYPGIESLRMIAGFYEVSLDELLSPDAMLTLAEEDQKHKTTQMRDLVCGFLDLCMALLLWLPLFAERSEEIVRAVPLLSLSGIQPYLKVGYLFLVIGMVMVGILTLALQNCRSAAWVRCKTLLSLSLGAVAVFLFMLGLHPYAAVFSLMLLTVKAVVMLKRQ